MAINAIILHFTASATLLGTVNWFKKVKSRVSAHYVIGRGGQVVQMVQESDKAWHAGKAKLDGDPRVNSMSIGIELVNWGRLKKRGSEFFCWPRNYRQHYDRRKYGKPFRSEDGKWWAPYTEEQLEALAKLCSEIVQRHPAITRNRVVGHEHVAPGRKNDPGPALDIEWVRDKVFAKRLEEPELLPESAYLTDDPSDSQLAKRQGDRAEPVSLLERVIAIFNGHRRG